MRANNFMDLTGHVYGAWQVLKILPNKRNGRIYWERERMERSAKKEMSASNLRSKDKLSHRGCYLFKGTRKHGMRHTRLYRIWSNVKDRCYNLNFSSIPVYGRYGARGIGVCKEWHDAATFFKWALSHGYSDELQIDRINNDGDYEPANRRWVTRSQNCRNKRGNGHITIAGETKLLCEWAGEAGIRLTALISRIKRGWKEEWLLLPKFSRPQFKSNTLWLADRKGEKEK